MKVQSFLSADSPARLAAYIHTVFMLSSFAKSPWLPLEFAWNVICSYLASVAMLESAGCSEAQLLGCANRTQWLGSTAHDLNPWSCSTQATASRELSIRTGQRSQSDGSSTLVRVVRGLCTSQALALHAWREPVKHNSKYKLEQAGAYLPSLRKCPNGP